MSSSRAYNRDVSRRKALRKRRITKEVYHEASYYDNLHQYSKNKIHCSCPLCSAKTRNKGKHRAKVRGYEKSINYKFSDLRKTVAMDIAEKDFENSPLNR